tara:strand:+ start:3485 stop:4048 length:564 start_codon:yes stop_codon:yes gene_type:complete
MEVDIDLLVENNLTPDEYVFLYYLAKSQIYSVNLVTDYEKLEKAGLIKIGDRIYIRKKGSDLINTKRSEVIKTAPLEDTVAVWIDNWRSLFPQGVKTAGYAIRGTRGGCAKKMKKFMREHKEVTKEQIFKATELYVEEKRRVRYAYMRIADYFIEKDGGSLLESYVEQLSNNETSSDERVNILTDDI